MDKEETQPKKMIKGNARFPRDVHDTSARNLNRMRSVGSSVAHQGCAFYVEKCRQNFGRLEASTGTNSSGASEDGETA